MSTSIPVGIRSATEVAADRQKAVDKVAQDMAAKLAQGQGITSKDIVAALGVEQAQEERPEPSMAPVSGADAPAPQGISAVLDHKRPSTGDALPQRKVDISTEDKTSFVKAIVTGAPWSRTYALFGGAMQVTCYDRPFCYDDAIIAWARYLYDAQLVRPGIEFFATIQALTVQLTAFTAGAPPPNIAHDELFPKMSPGIAVTPANAVKAEDLPEWVRAAISRLSSTSAAFLTLVDVVGDFDARHRILVAGAMKSDF